jgi:hypothetical protein
MTLRSRRAVVTSTVITSAAVATVACVGLAGAHAQASAAGTSQVLHLHGRVVQQQLLDAAPSGPSLGDEQVASGRLTNDAGKRVGSFGFTCTNVGVTRVQITEQCAGWGQLSHGVLTASGMSRYTDSRHVWAVTGGTGSYAADGGTVVIVDRSGNREDLTIRLR